MEIKNFDKIKSLNLDVPPVSKAYAKNVLWLKENRNKIAKYESNWIAIYNEEIFAFSTSPYELEDEIKNKSLNAEEVTIHYLVNSNCIF